MQEQWRPVVGYEESYSVSNLGRVRSIDRISRGRWGLMPMKGKILKPFLDSSGYEMVDLHVDGIGSSLKLHRLVAFAFVDGYQEGHQVNHMNGIKTFNYASNLEWCTQLENMRHAIRTGLKGPMPKGSSSPSFKGPIVASPVVAGGVGFVLFGSLHIRSVDLHPSAVTKCLQKAGAAHKGYTFERVLL